MSRGWTLAQSFAHFGARAINPVWAWAAASPDEKTVVLTVWEGMLKPDGTIDLFGDEELPQWTNLHGNRDRIRKLKLARENCGELFRVVMVKAKDTTVSPRSIASAYPDKTRIMRLVKLDEASGEFSAVTVEC